MYNTYIGGLAVTLSTDAKKELPDILKRYTNGEAIPSIAKLYDVSARTIYNWLFAGIGDKQWYDLVSCVLADRVCEADAELWNSTDMFQIARARELARFARMDLERRRPALYGQKQQIESRSIKVVVNGKGRFLEVP